MNEAETRAEHIDPALAAAGWGAMEGSRVLREFRIAPGRIEAPGACVRISPDDTLIEGEVERPANAMSKPTSTRSSRSWSGRSTA